MVEQDEVPLSKLMWDELGLFFLLMLLWDIIRSFGIAFLTNHLIKKNKKQK